jgi:hypothetical protein
MARLTELLSEAAAALASLDELASRDTLSLAERDGAILRLVYTFEAIWKDRSARAAIQGRHRGRFSQGHDPRLSQSGLLG